MTNSLTYQLLDEIELLAANRGTADSQVTLAAKWLGPLIQLQRSRARAALSATNIQIEYGPLGEAASFITSPIGLYINQTGNVGIASARDPDATSELAQRALFAANRVRFPKAGAAQAISALGELESNIVEHSYDAVTGVIAFEVQPKFVGLYASDSGVGVLSSLKRNPSFSSLDDSGRALEMALQEGVSTHQEAGRGMGFRPIFRGLASLATLLRFRSGDSLLQINRFGGGPPQQELHERAEIAGFHVFVHCTFS